VDDADVLVLDQEQDVGSGVGPPDTDLVQTAGQAQGDAAGLSILSVRTRSCVLAAHTSAGERPSTSIAVMTSRALDMVQPRPAVRHDLHHQSGMS
jgi:hypothetical protein